MVEDRERQKRYPQTLEELVTEHQFPLVDGVLHKCTEALAAHLGVHKFDVNTWWCLTPAKWVCPGCKRNKAQIARVNKHDELSCHLVVHHDHMESFILKRLGEHVGTLDEFHATPESEEFAKRLSRSISAFDPVLTCVDCNNIDAVGKRILGCHSAFSFTCSDIAQFVRPAANQPHGLDEEQLNKVWEFRQQQLLYRLALADKIVQIAASNKQWYEKAPLGCSPEHVVYLAKSYLSRATSWPGDSVVQQYLNIASTKPHRESVHTAWRRKKAVRCDRPPNGMKLKFLAEVTHRGHYKAVSDEWKCPWCQRNKLHCVRPSDHHHFAFMIRDNKMINVETREKFKILTCQDCNDVRSRLAREAGVRVEAVLSEDVVQVITAEPHSQHVIVADHEVDVIVQGIIRRARSLGLEKPVVGTQDMA
jgi:rubredoxin